MHAEVIAVVESEFVAERQLPTTVPGVIASLDSIVRWSEGGASRVGYFAALYGQVTCAIRERLGTSYFDDDARMERLVVTFAGRYLAALQDYAHGGSRCTAPWRVTFDEVGDPHLMILQHLMLGMNAHIELDLGIAVAEVAPGAELERIRGDFDKINDLLAGVSPTVEAELGALSPLFRLAELAAKPLEKPVVDLGMWLARHTAWQFAEDLAPLDSAQRARAIEERATTVGDCARELTAPTLLVRAAFAAVALTECRDVRKVIRRLSHEAPASRRAPARRRGRGRGRVTRAAG